MRTYVKLGDNTIQDMTLTYLLGDHLGSTSLTTDKTGEKVSEIHHKPCPYGMLREGEIRSTWTREMCAALLS